MTGEDPNSSRSQWDPSAAKRREREIAELEEIFALDINYDPEAEATKKLLGDFLADEVTTLDEGTSARIRARVFDTIDDESNKFSDGQRTFLRTLGQRAIEGMHSIIKKVKK